MCRNKKEFKSVETVNSVHNINNIANLKVNKPLIVELIVNAVS